MNRYRYGAYDDGPDPLAPPYDAGRAVDELGDRVLDGSGVQDALRDLLQRGADGVRGLDDLLRKVMQRRRSLERSGRMDGMLEQAREMLDRAVELERQALFPDPSDDARFREAQLDALPDQTARAVRELAEYDWRSPEARQAFEDLKDMLRRDVLDQQFRGMKQALQSQPGSAERQALKDMMADLNQLLEKHARGEDTQDDFEQFMDKHGQFFPERPENIEQLLDQLARQAAAMQRMLESMSPEQRQELMELMEEALGDLDLASEMQRLTDNLRAARPDLPWSGQQRLRGDQPLGLGDATEALADLADLDALAEQLSQDYPGSSLEDVDEEAVARALGRQSVDDLRRLQEIQRELERQGYLTRKGGEVELTAKAIRRIGQTALRRVFASLESGARGDHDVRDAGSAGELTGTTREWRFGDEQPLDVVRTVSNSVRRRMIEPDSPLLRPEDFEIRETERRTRAAVVLLVDQSFSMVMNDTWRTAKTTAMALHALATTQFPLDAVEIIAFANLARRIAPHELPDLDANQVQGTNLQHALMLAGRFLDKHPDAEPVVLVVTDGEPTAHLDRDGEWWFSWPPGPETIELTLAEVDKMTRRGVPLSFFRLGDEPRLARFLDDVARRNGGRVLAPEGDRLGDYVVSDYLKRRQGRRRSA
ncbi:MAG: VWA domain-containing protein [Candidatus Nanopelagicales bacterium]